MTSEQLNTLGHERGHASSAIIPHVHAQQCALPCAGSGQVLRPGGLMLVYGPFKRDGQCTTESNASFDRSLRSQNPEWGYRCAAVAPSTSAAPRVAQRLLP